MEEAVSPKDDYCGRLPFNESAITVQGRLWANVFKFALDLHQLYDAYCAIISNPDEESKYICLRRFIIVLYECDAIKVRCQRTHIPNIVLLGQVTSSALVIT